MKKLSVIAGLALALGLIVPSEAGWNFKSMSGLQVNIEYMGYAFRNSAGDPVYRKGDTIRYRVSIYNTGNRPFKSFPMESGLYWAGAVSCTLPNGQFKSVGPGIPLPGMSSSGSLLMDIPKGGSDFFDASYRVPTDVCPNMGEVHLDAGRGGGKEALRIPMRFEIRN